MRYYKNAGFDVIKYVGDDWKNVPDRLIWGGYGTLLRQDIEFLLDFWTGRTVVVDSPPTHAQSHPRYDPRDRLLSR